MSRKLTALQGRRAILFGCLVGALIVAILAGTGTLALTHNGSQSRHRELGFRGDTSNAMTPRLERDYPDCGVC